jgi:hypothetical protein
MFKQRTYKDVLIFKIKFTYLKVINQTPNKHFFSDSTVVTPNDGDKWLLAKQTVQVADFIYVGSVEHLLKTHLFVEPICVAMLRHFHSLHPLRQLLKFHCRGVSGTNKFNIKNLTGIGGTSDRLFAVGHSGGYKLLRKAFEASSWDDTDFVANIKVILLTNYC